MLNILDTVTQEEEDDFFKTLSKNVKRIRKERKISQLEVALSMGHSSSGFYANLENYSHGKHFNLKHLFRLSKLFGVSIEEFFKSSKEN